MIDSKHVLALRDRLIQDRGSLMFLALAEREDLTGTWDLLIAGGGFPDGGLDDWKYVADVLDQVFTRSELLSLNYFTLIREENDWLQQLVDETRVDGDKPVEVQNVEWGTMPVRRALIFHAQPAEVGAARA
jgi:hypothetical protein